MELEALINLAWLLVGGGLFFIAMRYLGNDAITDGVSPIDKTEDGDNGNHVRDPVCGMQIDPNTDITWIHGGKNYYFCSMSCRGRFRRTPKEFLRPLHAISRDRKTDAKP